jgi:hypothetical protein
MSQRIQKGEHASFGEGWVDKDGADEMVSSTAWTLSDEGFDSWIVLNK